MDYYRFYLSYSGHNLNDANFLIVGSVFKTNPVGIFVIANKEDDNCALDRIERIDPSTYKINIKDITRAHIGEQVKYKFQIIYSTSDGKLLRQTLKYDGKSELSVPTEVNL